jgi:hypothetical protein
MLNEPGPRGSSNEAWPPRGPGSGTIDNHLRPSPLNGKALDGRNFLCKRSCRNIGWVGYDAFRCSGGCSTEVDVFRTFLLFSLLFAYISSTAACTGGCWSRADAVRTVPTTDCLTLFTGNSPTDHTVCQVPQLAGVNNCSDTLTFPKRSASAIAVTFVPGQDIAWLVPSQSVSPAIMVNQVGGNTTDYVIIATLGSQSITITIPVHN